jgi:soluble P-type ATPase
MIEISIPGHKQLKLEHLVLDYNGTIAFDGHLLSGLKETLEILSSSLQIHVLTADTFGSVISELSGIPVELSIIPVDNQDQGKLEYVQKLGIVSTVAIGNGRNDRLMLKGSALGIAVIQAEGACVETLLAADVVCQDILSALHLLMNPKRLAATLRL